MYVIPDSFKWPNVLLLCELLFSLPVSNGHVESVFSSVNVIKCERRASKILKHCLTFTQKELH